MKTSKGEGGVIHRDTYKGGNGGNIQAIGNSHYLFSVKLRCLVFQITLFIKNYALYP